MFQQNRLCEFPAEKLPHDPRIAAKFNDVLILARFHSLLKQRPVG
jgi:hypothetical protein